MFKYAKIPEFPYRPIDFNDEKFLSYLGFELGEEYQFNHVWAVSEGLDTIDVLGYRNNTRLFLPNPSLELSLNKEDVQKMKERGKISSCKTFSIWDMFWDKAVSRRIETYIQRNLKNAERKIEHIKLYQGSIEEIQKDLGRSVKRLETGKPETFLKEDDTFMLRVRSYLMGADAIVHYQPGSSIGTPVKFVQ